MPLRQLPNLLTLLRILLVAPIVAAILSGNHGAALAMFVVAGISDALDGVLARRLAWGSRLGAILDPVADKLLVTLTFLALAIEGALPVWLLAAALARDLLIGIGALAYRIRVGPFEARPLLVSKLNTLLQLGLVTLVLLPWPGVEARSDALEGLFLLSLVSLVVSGGAYVLVWGEHARRQLGRGGGDRSPRRG